MNKNEHQEWLNGLKIGDEVAVSSYRLSTKSYEIRKITRITPTRRFTVEGKGNVFDSTGREYGKGSSWVIADEIEPVTQDIRDYLRKKHVLARLNNSKWDVLDLEKLERLLQVLDSDDERPEANDSTAIPSEAAAE